MILAYLEPSDDFYHPEDTNRKQCRRCFQRLPRSEFNRQSSRPDGLFSYCRPCFKQYRQELAERKRQGDFQLIVHRAAWSKRDKAVIAWARRVIDGFGGVERAADVAYRLLMDASSSDRPTAFGHEFFIVLLRILHYEQTKLDELAAMRPDVRKMSDREVATELQELVRES